jgi:hypothetical protein
MVPYIMDGARSPDVPVTPVTARDEAGPGTDPPGSLSRSLPRRRDAGALAAGPRPCGAARQVRRHGAGAVERDLVLLAYDDATSQGSAAAPMLRRHGFGAILMGKDGGEKLSSGQPPGTDGLLLDAMPIRRQEMRQPP